MYKTILENRTKIPWYLWKNGTESSEFQIAPKSVLEIESEADGMYAPYERITRTEHRGKHDERIIEVKCERRKHYDPPEVQGWTLCIENMTGDPTGAQSYREGDFRVNCPYRIPIMLWNLDPRLSVCQFRRLYRTEDKIVRVFDPRTSDGYRTVTQQGTMVGERRSEIELQRLQADRDQIQKRSITELRALERDRLAREEKRGEGE